MLTMLTALAAVLAPSSPDCTPVSGAERLWQDNIRWVIVGEHHGTNETPDAFANLVCLASQSGRPVTVALEYNSDDQSVIDRFLATADPVEARQILLSLPRWHWFTQNSDGRTSTAFLRLFETLRTMKRQGMITGIIASDVPSTWRGTPDRDAEMGRNWQAIAVPTNGLIVALVGNVHAVRLASFELGGRSIVPAASYLPRPQTMTLSVEGNAGTAWNCNAQGCGAHAYGGNRQSTAGITYSTKPEHRWDAIYELGVATTASEPVTIVPSDPD